MACPGKRSLTVGCAALLAAGGAWIGLLAQPPTGAGRGAAAASPDPVQIVIEREALRLIDPRTLHVPLQLAPVRSVELTAAVDGFVRSVRIQTGQTLQAQEEAVRLDGREEQLLLQRARAGVKVAEIEIRSARESGNAVAGELAAARLEIAKADVELASLRLERAVVRGPFDGRILRTHAMPGAYVRAGEPLAVLVDTHQLTVEIPVDRAKTAAGQSVEVRVEDQAVEGRVTELLPLAARFEPLRTVIHSVASATLLIENGDGRLQVGQTVYAPLVPRQPVVEVPTDTLSNTPDGSRQVLVLRGDTVREIEVQLLGPVGSDRLFVSGAFAEGDELVLNASQALTDGTRVRPATAAVTRTASPVGDEPAASRTAPDGDTLPPRRSRF